MIIKIVGFGILLYNEFGIVFFVLEYICNLVFKCNFENIIKCYEINKFLRKFFYLMFIILNLFEFKREEILKNYSYML